MLKKFIIERRALIKESFGREYLIAAFSSCNYYGIKTPRVNNEEGD